jgi:phosphoglycolate phosphatase-like HAD superfamily hydrolase
MSLDLKHYRTLVFDCDGVVLDSNQLKTEAYYRVAVGFGANHEQAQALVDYHVRLGGISRFIKFRYFLDEILHQPVTEEAMNVLLESFAEEIHRELLICEMAPGLMELRELTKDARWMLVSGGDQIELRSLFMERGIDDMFDAGIFGSPDNKDVILERETASGNLAQPGIFFGDSRYDHEASTRADLDFVFVSQWTELQNWQNYCRAHNITVIERLGDALPT